MRFQINAEEFEESEETKTGAMRYKVMEAVQRTNYLENVYEQKADCIRMRKRNLGWAIGLSLGVAILLALIVATMWIFTRGSGYGAVFAMWPILLLSVMTVLFVFNALRKLASFLTHQGVFSAPLRMIYNRRVKRYTYEELQTTGVYTLAEEERECQQLLKQIRNDRKELQAYLGNPEATVEAGEEILAYMDSHFEEKDRKATLLYGERV